VTKSPQNIEQEISNDEVWIRSPRRRRYNPYEPQAALSLLSKILMIEYLTSIFVIPCSIFVIRFFRVSLSIRLNNRGHRRQLWTLKPETLNL